MEQMIIDKLGGDSSTTIDFCLQCQAKAFKEILNKNIDNVPDAKVRHALRIRWNRVDRDTTIEAAKDVGILDN